MTIEDYIRQQTIDLESDHYDDFKHSLAEQGLNIKYNAYQGRSIAVFTSGGDSQVGLHS